MENKLTSIQSEAIIWAMFGVENEIQHLKYLLISSDEKTHEFLESQLELRQAHFEAFKELLGGKE